MIKNNNLAPSILLRRAAWIALLPVALLQLAIAVHQFDHVAGYGDSVCHVCAQLDRIDAAVDHAAEKSPPPSIEFLVSEAPAVLVAREAVRNFDSRAPPLL